MPKHAIAFEIEDISAFARLLGKQLQAAKDTPSHLSLLNMLARAGGYRNFQHLRAEGAGRQVAAAAAEERFDPRPVERAFIQFDAAGQLLRFPAKRSLQILCVWALWARLPRGEVMAERRVNELLNTMHLFGDPALLRRDMVEMGLLTRQADGSDYRRVEQKPPPPARELIRRLATR
ncbi:DUF2087 domain-containing protein [Sandaracinobacter neustonicus]|uniref:DUF2087 domain-containing protein n=1 Tax=Sandaracinobacter neustonicus TaxID=1715348 RepID=A0A501XQE5_9SPHN|nr:DUF2087 domain-containing protein [Sandaracinobacter neustonicus]TPE62901.1 DUF2087 domain-containing protein [Sandaracinobacter neustonicus]